MKSTYKFDAIEKKWQTFWEENRTFKTKEDTEKAKYYILDMFPYPSGAGLHVGHPEGYTATDIVARYKRMSGFNVLHPMGWDAFGLPAERAAIRENIHPAKITERNIANFKKQIKRLGFSYDWDREICTSDPSYYKWTQWIFTKMYEQGLAYIAEVPVNWCPAQGTVLANEEVSDGKYIETGDVVERRVMKQWMLKITEYAERLLEGLDDLDWPKNVIEMQKNWIGKSVGAEIKFRLSAINDYLTIFTTRPETIYGVTFCVLAPDHPLLQKIVPDSYKEKVEDYCAEIRNMSDRDKEVRAAKRKTGVYSGADAINPVTGESIQIWVSDYVKLDYGSGAVMAVPAHDDNDKEFAEIFKIRTREVIDCNDVIINSGEDSKINGLNILDARNKMLNVIEELGIGCKKTNYKLRDWLFSRQRYWGEPFPVVYNSAGEDSCMSISDLPLTLPEIEDFKPTGCGNPPLGRAVEWVKCTYNGSEMVRELNTMPQWAGSCWYYLRYMDPKNDDNIVDREKEKYWGQVDLYVGGLEHAVSHLLYARFWHKVLYDCGVVSTNEPFKKLFNQGMILGVSYKDENNKYYHVDDVVEEGGSFYSKKDNKKLVSMIEKMSKSKFNVINPDDVVRKYGADALRMYEMFMGPLEITKSWQMNGVKGVYNFLQKVWRMSVNENSGELSNYISHDMQEADDDIRVTKKLHITIAKVTSDIENLKFNTAIASMMEFINVCKKADRISKAAWQKFILILSPFAPHIAEEIWQKMGNRNTLSYENWPEFDEKYSSSDIIEMVFCINGKKVSSSKMESGQQEEAVKDIMMQDSRIVKKISGKEIVKVIFVANKLMNVIIK